MNASEKGTFYYHACANPIGGHITEPMQHTLPAQGSAALAQAGGHAAGAAGPHRIHGVLSYRTAYSEVHGSKMRAERGDAYVSQVTSVIEDLNVLNGRIKAKSIVATITVRHPHNGGHPSVSFKGTEYIDFTIDGVPVHPDLDLRSLARTESHAGRKEATHYEYEPEMMNAAREHHARLTEKAETPDWLKRRYRRLQGVEPDAGNTGGESTSGGNGMFIGSLVKHAAVEAPNANFGHIIHVPDVGNLFLAELCVKDRLFRVTMLRLELGCAVRGDMSVCSADTNGTIMPGVDGDGGPR